MFIFCVNSASILLHFPSLGYAQEGMEPTKTMVYQVLIQKMIICGLGTDTDTRGQQQMRSNLLQIIQVEVLLENAGWDTVPGAR